MPDKQEIALFVTEKIEKDQMGLEGEWMEMR